MEPASTIIKICGGFKAVADMTGRDETRVRRWTYEKERGGTGGMIPSDMQPKILRGAAERGLPLTPEHFFPEWDDLAQARAGSVDQSSSPSSGPSAEAQA